MIIKPTVGDQMGRGRRPSLYVIDEAAFIERADSVDAATSANSDVRTSVTLRQDEDATTEWQYCEGMPYQLGQAAKHVDKSS